MMEKKKNDQPFIIPPSFYKVAPEGVKKADHTATQKETSAHPQSTHSVQPSTPVEVVEQKVQEQPVAKPVVPNTTSQAPEKETKPEVAQPNIGISKERISGLSLKGLQRKKELEEKRKEQKIDVTNLPREPFTEIAMQAAWKEYVTKLSNQGEKIIASNLEADTPRLINDTVITLEYPNATMKVEVERAQGPLLEFLKRKLNNYDISLDITVNEEVQRKYAYTPQEKYEKLKEQNPDLEILKRAFDLEL